jgi:N-acetylmuramoyl-L-alanine amidase
MPAAFSKKYKIITSLFPLLCIFFAANCFAQQNTAAVPNRFKFKTVIIDAGHGGKDPGSHGAYSKEKNVSLVALKW